MAKIKATGRRNGVLMVIEVIDGETFIDGEQEDVYDFFIHQQHPMGGTYYAEPTSMENILNTLTYHFFDSEPEIETEGSLEEIPYEEGRIY